LHAINDKDNLQRFDKMQIAAKWKGEPLTMVNELVGRLHYYSVPRTRAASAFSMFFMLIYEYKSLSPRPSHAWEHSAYA